jgi:hypothetical protein
MITRPLAARLLALAALLLMPMVARAADPADGVMKKMMDALRSKNHEAFIADCDDTMRTALSKDQFDNVAAAMAANLQPGHKIVPLGKLRQKGHTVHLYRLEPPKGADDVLIRMSMKDKKVSGFFLQ